MLSLAFGDTVLNGIRLKQDIQEVSLSILNGSNNAQATINQVDWNNTLILPKNNVYDIYESASAADPYVYNTIIWGAVNATTVQVKRQSSTSNGPTFEAYIIELDGVRSIQCVEYTGTNNTTPYTEAINQVDPDRSFIIHQGCYNTSGAPDWINHLEYLAPYYDFDSATAVSIAFPSGLNNYNVRGAFCVVEL